MKIIFTKHAEKRIKERGIKKSWIEEIIALPDYTVSKENKIEAYKNLDGKTLKVIYIKDKFIKIISVMWK